MDSQQPEKPRHPLERPRDEADKYASPFPTRPAPEAPPPESTRRIAIPQSTPLFTYIILGINIIVFLIDSLLDGQLTLAGGKYNPAIIHGEYWRLFTHMFLHGSLIHIGFNGYFLYLIGAEVERAFGRFRFLAIYFLSGFGGAILSFIGSPDALSVGASGALFGLIGALLPLLYRNRNILANTQRRIMSIVQTIVINLVIGFLPGTHIDYWAHIGGLITGLAAAWFTTPLYAVRFDPSGMPERIEDTTSLQTSWFWYVLFGIGMAALMAFLIWMSSSSTL